jgi:acyl phosphate:glycerol-3-phosphate acyltransferase
MVTTSRFIQYSRRAYSSTMPAFPLIAALAIGAYLLGSIPWGLILTRAAGLGDIRRVGSGNIGATNVLRTGWRGLAAATLALDAGKGALAVAIGWHWGETAACAAAVAAILGHLFPAWLKFKGGKGVATAAGALFMLAWQVALAGLATWIAVVLVSRYSSLGAITATALAPLYAYLITRDPALTVTVVLIALLILSRHRANIARLKRGEESRVSFGRRRTS